MPGWQSSTNGAPSAADSSGNGQLTGPCQQQSQTALLLQLLAADANLVQQGLCDPGMIQWQGLDHAGSSTMHCNFVGLVADWTPSCAPALLAHICVVHVGLG
jgi:hypothetical protein